MTVSPFLSCLSAKKFFEKSSKSLVPVKSYTLPALKALSNSLLGETIHIYADNENDLVFNLLIDDGTFDIILYIAINKYN